MDIVKHEIPTLFWHTFFSDKDKYAEKWMKILPSVRMGAIAF